MLDPMDAAGNRSGPDRTRGRPSGLPRIPAPHPRITILGILLAIGVWFASRNSPPDMRIYFLPVAVILAGLFVYISRRSVRREAIRRQQKLEELRKKPVLGLDD